MVGDRLLLLREMEPRHLQELSPHEEETVGKQRIGRDTVMEWTGKNFGYRSSLWLPVVLGLALLSTVGHLVEAAPATVNLIALKDAVCEYETRNEPDPDAAVGANGEFGRCQIRLGTARQLGFKAHPAMLFIRDVNEEYALKKLTWCRTPSYDKAGNVVHHGYQTAAGIAWCYNGGKMRGKLNKADPYVQAVMEIYQRKILAAR